MYSKNRVLTSLTAAACILLMCLVSGESKPVAGEFFELLPPEFKAGSSGNGPSPDLYRQVALLAKVLLNDNKLRKSNNDDVKRSDGSLSIVGSLDALADMISAQEAKKLQNQLKANKMRLMRLGKRNIGE
ncbi:uncharacterized protein LOC141910118 [Tubulanus polymorphus]|uniref:uncharacterized protein LOC141910118 n=1 Tax=Tubulanus polymorphus TaxID=672921 RepID=UPI003DA6321F